jgi:hypothetical protein
MDFVIEPELDGGPLNLDRIPPIPPCPCAYGEATCILNG